jgi:serine phosphatase RsbU (regulator of sigma subunit)
MRILFFLCLYFFGLGKACLAQTIWQLAPNQINTPPKNAFMAIERMGHHSVEEMMSVSFQSVEQEFPHFGLSRDTIWVKFTVQSMAKEEMDWLLEIKAPFLSIADFYIQDSVAQWKVSSVGYSQPFEQRRFFNQHPKLAIHLKPLEKKTVYLRANGFFAIMPFVIAPTEILREEHTKIHFIYGIYFGLVAFVLLSNLFSLFTYKKSVYFFYSAYVITSVLFTSWLTGYIFWFSHKSPLIYYYSGLVFGAITQVNIAQFLILFLKLDHYSPLHKRLLTIYSLFAPIAYSLLIVFFGVYEMMLLGLILANVLTFLGMEGAWKVHKKGHPTAIYFFVAYTIFLIGVTTVSLYAMGIINNIWAKYGYDWAALCEMVLISFALSVQQRKDKEKAQGEALLQAEENKRLVQEQNVVLEEKVKLRTNEIDQQKEEIAQTLHIVSEQKHVIEQKNEDIIASINYALRIQKAIIPTETELQKHFDCFVFFRPRDIVSGDFYWFADKGTVKILAVADCTGHGVSGAFMTMIGNNILNQLIHDQEIREPAQILNAMSALLEKTLVHSHGKVKDGMDISILAIHPKGFQNSSGMMIEYAGAMNPFYYVQNQEFKEIKADKKPIKSRLT